VLIWWRSAVNRSFFLCLAACRTRSSSWITRSRPCVRSVLCCLAFPLVPALRSIASATVLPALFGDFIAVGSEEAPIEELASVRHSNGTCSFPAFRFHEWFREVRREGIGETRVTLSTREWTFCF